MIAVRNTSSREIIIKELHKTIPVCNNTYIVPDMIYEKYKNQLSMVSISLNNIETKKIFNTETIIINEADVSNRSTQTDGYLSEIVMVDGVEYTIAPVYD